MISKKQLYGLGYFEKPDNINMRDGSTDFKHENFDERTYLVNLNQGNITIIFPINNQQKSFRSYDYDEFLKWHELYTVNKL